MLTYAQAWRAQVLHDGRPARRTVRELADELGLSPGDCLVALARLEARGLIRVRFHPGARLEILAVEPTPGGLD